MKLTNFVIFLTAIVLASPFTVNAKEKTKPKISSKETTKSNELTMGMSKCAQIGIPLVRLRCFDELAGTQIKGKPKSAEPANNINGKWDVSVKPDPVDDIKTVTLSLNAEDNTRVWMVIRCKSNKTEFFVNWDTSLETYKDVYGNIKTHVLTRIGKEKAENSIWHLSTDKNATFYPDPPIPFIKKLFTNDIFLAQVTRSYDPNSFSATFDLKGLENAIKPLIETCNWE